MKKLTLIILILTALTASATTLFAYANMSDHIQRGNFNKEYTTQIEGSTLDTIYIYTDYENIHCVSTDETNIRMELRMTAFTKSEPVMNNYLTLDHFTSTLTIKPTGGPGNEYLSFPFFGIQYEGTLTVYIPNTFKGTIYMDAKRGTMTTDEAIITNSNIKAMKQYIPVH